MRSGIRRCSKCRVAGSKVWQPHSVPERETSVREAACGRYPYHPALRWLYTAFAGVWLALGVVQLVRHEGPWLLFLAAAWTGLAVLYWRNVVVVDKAGVKWMRGGLVPWSEVQPFVPPPNDGWTHQSVLVIRDGVRRPLPQMTASQLDSLAQLTRLDRPPSG